MYTYYFMSSGKAYILRDKIVTAGIVLGFAMLFTVLAGSILRRLKYELFYVIHLALFVVIVVTLGMHRPSFDPDKTLIATVLIASAWFSDRLIRFTRLVYNSINNEAVVFPLPNGGTRIVLKKPLSRARPGSKFTNITAECHFISTLENRLKEMEQFHVLQTHKYAPNS